MEALPLQFDQTHEEISNSIEELSRNLSNACGLVEEFLGRVKARSNRTILRAEHIECFTDFLIGMAAIVSALSPSICSCHDWGSGDDPHGLVQSIEDLVSRLDSLLRTTRWLVLKMRPTEQARAHRLNEVAAELAGSIASIISVVKCHRCTRALVAERPAATPTHPRRTNRP